MGTNSHPKTFQSAEIKSEFQLQGMSIAAWARARAFDPRLVYAVLGGRNKASRGKSHQIAIALGIKPGPQITERTMQLGLASALGSPDGSVAASQQGESI